MESREELVAKLSELETEVVEPSSEQPQRGKKSNSRDDQDIWGSSLPADWKPEPRFQSPHKPGSDPATFRIGDIFQDARPGPGIYGPHHAKRQPFPHPRHPQPAAPLTPEIDEQYWREYESWADGVRALHTVIFVRGQQILKNPYFEDESSKQWLERNQTWLNGAWSARTMTPPSQETIDQWAREHYTKEKARAQTAEAKNG